VVITEKQAADIFIKPLKIELFYKMKKMFGMTSLAAWQCSKFNQVNARRL